MADVCPSCGAGIGYRCNRLVCGRDRIIACTVSVAGQIVQRDIEVPARQNRVIAEQNLLQQLGHVRE